MPWALRRQLMIGFLLLIVLAGGVFLYIRPMLFAPPMCTNGKQDGNETGVDCGGTCVNLCSFEVKPLVVLWQRSFPITNNVYNAVAYIENQNDAAISQIPYEFRLYDDKGLFITRVDGVALVPPSGRYAIIETGIPVGNSVVGTTSFEFGQARVPWVHISQKVEKLHITSQKVQLDDVDHIPKLSASITNTSPTFTLFDTNVAAIIYDANGNAISASKTFVHSLAPLASSWVFFTWPKDFSVPVVRYDIIPIIDVFHATE